jgi:hypothetical protein
LNLHTLRTLCDRKPALKEEVFLLIFSTPRAPHAILVLLKASPQLHRWVFLLGGHPLNGLYKFDI